jgi:hypothetical protein
MLLHTQTASGQWNLPRASVHGQGRLHSLTWRNKNINKTINSIGTYLNAISCWAQRNVDWCRVAKNGPQSGPNIHVVLYSHTVVTGVNDVGADQNAWTRSDRRTTSGHWFLLGAFLQICLFAEVLPSQQTEQLRTTNNDLTRKLYGEG